MRYLLQIRKCHILISRQSMLTIVEKLDPTKLKFPIFQKVGTLDDSGTGVVHRQEMRILQLEPCKLGPLVSTVVRPYNLVGLLT